MATDKMANNDIQKIKQKPKDRAARTPLKAGVNSDAYLGNRTKLRHNLQLFSIW